MTKNKRTEKQAPKGNKQARRDAMIEKLLSVDDLRQIAGGVTPRPCCKPCD